MGESLMMSWLKHAKGCHLVQLNWKPSTQWEPIYNMNECEKIIKKLETKFSAINNEPQEKLLKNNKLKQFLSQAEIDVLGFNYMEDIFYAVDIAFHEDGLLYGNGAKETSRRIVSKMIRSALSLFTQFNVKGGEIIFASPKVFPGPLKEIEKDIDNLNIFMTGQGFEFDFKFICNEDFKENILEPIIKISEDVADTSELFMRAFQLQKIFKDKKDMNK